MCDTLRRAGHRVVMASCEGTLEVECSRGVRIRADALLDAEVASEAFDAILLPGGMPGAERLRDCPTLVEMLKQQRTSGKLYGAICASPAVVLKEHGLLDGVGMATCHPGFMGGLVESSEARVVLGGNCITSRGPGTTFEFALACIAVLTGQKSKVEEVANPMVLPSNFSADLVALKLGVA